MILDGIAMDELSVTSNFSGMKLEMLSYLEKSANLPPAQSAQGGTALTKFCWAGAVLGAKLAPLVLNLKSRWVGSWGLMKGLKLGSTGSSA